jgi:hypothetical protein
MMISNARAGVRVGAVMTVAAGVVLSASLAIAGKVETWKHDTASAFAKGKRDRVVTSDAGRVRLAHVLQPTESFDALRVWDLVRAPGGAVYAATGDEGKVFRSEGDGPWTLAYDAADTQALSLVVGPGGHVFAGTGPSGQVVDLTHPDHPASRPDPGVSYIWDLAADAEGNLYAATGPTGQLWKRSPEGDWKLLLDSKHPHLLCVAVGPDKAVYAGSDGEGLIYRVAPDGKTSVVYDAPQSEIRTLLFAPDGALYVGTAAEAGGSSSGGPNRGLAFSGGDTPSLDRGGPRNPTAASTPAAPQPQPQRKDEPKAASGGSAPAGGSAAPKPVSPGDNAVYRLGPDGVARELFRARLMVYALAWQGDRLLIGTGPEGQLYEVRELGRESAPIARLDRGQILALLADGQGELLLGAGDPGAVVKLSPGHATSGTLTSDVLDTKFSSRFGALSWRAELPAGTSVALQCRSGNVGEPDDTWSAWSSKQTDPASAKAEVPPGRFAQFRATLSTTDPAVSPELHSVALRYQTSNLPPEISKIDVPDLSEGDGAARQTKLTLRWDVTDPNGDELSYTLHIRKDGWPDWVKLGDAPLSEKTFAWDTTAVPAGIYRLRVTASDRPSNDPEEALSRDRISETFIVDHQAPSVTVTPKASGAVSVQLTDALTRLVKAAYALDGGEWVSVFPDDGLFDMPKETISISLPDLKPGTHVITVRATDAAGNVGAGDAVFKTP